MSKIPVGATTARAYRFAFGGFVNLVRVSWLPLAGIIALMFLVVIPALSDIMNSLSTQAIGAAGASFLRILPAYLAVMLLFLVQVTAVTQLALGLPQGGGWLVFPFGRPLWRLVGAFLLLLLILIGILVVLGLLAVITSVTVGTGGIPWMSLVIRLLVDVVIFLLMVRLGFFLAPAAIAGPTLGLRRSWRLSQGNFWRLVAIILGLLLPFIVLELVALFWLMPHMPMPAPGMDSGQYRMAVMGWEAGIFTGLQSHRLIALPVWSLFTVLLYGLLVGAQCFAYRTVMENAEAS